MPLDQLAALLALAPDPTLVLDRSGRIAALDGRVAELAGEPAEALRGRPFETLIPQGVLDPDARLTLRRGDGSEFPVEISVRVLDVLDGVEAPALALALREVTLRRARAEQLRQRAARARLQAAENERSRWARELHDETLQSLAALHVLLASGVRAPTIELTRQRIALAQEQIEGTMDNIRGLINDLRPAALDELGLEASVRDLAARMQTAYGIDVETTVALREEDGAPRRLADDVETAAYRVVQECLSNAARHAGATRIAVEITQPARPPGLLRVRVSDDGCGFDVSRDAGGYGLRAMRERVDLLDGELTLRTAAGSGTEVLAAFPLDEVRGMGL